jgi:hypothetical protein
MTVQFRPGCFGSPLAYANGQPCLACPFRADCGPAAQSRAQTLKARYGIEAAVRATTHPQRDRKPEVRPVPRVPMMPSKGQEILERWRARGIDLKASVAKGVNPFENGAGFMRIAVRDLLAGGFTQAGLRDAYVRELGWGEGSASGHARFAIPALLVTGAARQTGERIVPFNVFGEPA